MSQTVSNTSNTTKNNFWASLSGHSVSDYLLAGLLAVNWAYPFYHISKLPSTIPMQYSWKGAVNWSGSKYLMFLLPIGASLAYYQRVYRPLEAKKVLFPLKVPEGADTKKVSTVVNVFRKIRGAVAQTAILAASVLLVKGINESASTRATWIRGGILGWVLATLFAYSGAQIALKRK